MDKGITKSGLKFTINEEISKKGEIAFYLADLQREDVPDDEKVKIFNEFLLETIFGGISGKYEFIRESKRIHGENATIAEMMGDIREIFEAINEKNSSSSATTSPKPRKK